MEEIHQLDAMNRNKFRVKVGAFWGKPAEEDVVASLANPYAPVDPVNTPSKLVERIRNFFRP